MQIAQARHICCATSDSTNDGLQQRDVFDYPTIQRCMVDLDAALFHHLLEPSMADWIGHIPADAPQNHLTFKMATIELDHRADWLGPSLAIIPRVKSWIVRFFDGANEPTCALSTIAFLGLRVGYCRDIYMAIYPRSRGAHQSRQDFIGPGSGSTRPSILIVCSQPSPK